MIKPARILSLNVGVPQKLEWEGRSITTSMLKTPVPGPLVVHADHIEGDKFASPQFHGVPYSVVYAFGMPSALEYARMIGRSSYEPGSLGENLTLDEFDEKLVSVGDVFRVGEVEIQATFPRIPCAKVNVRMEHAEGQKCLQDVGRSGVYFRVLKPGRIARGDLVERVREATVRFSIFDLYASVGRGGLPSRAEFDLAVANGAFPERYMETWQERLGL